MPRLGAALLLLVAGLALVAAPVRAPAAVAIALFTAFWPLARAWRGARETELRAAVVWATLAVALGILAQGVAWFEPIVTGRPGAGHVAYLSVLATLSALISVLNARSPGGGAWAILMGLLVLVFLIPWLEGPGLLRDAHGLGRLRLDAPWSLFYGLLVLAGVTNYLPTRYGPAAAWLALGFGLEYLGLSRSDWTRASRGLIWSAVPWTLAVAAWLADVGARRRRLTATTDRLESTWLWFRDHWGVVWALRVQERFNRTAMSACWPFRLGWYGPVSTQTNPAAVVPEAAEVTFKALIRRFATPARIDEASAREGT